MKLHNKRGMIHLQRVRIRELIKAIEENEGRGYECVKPIQKHYFSGKNFDDKDHLMDGISRIKRKKFVDAYESCYYEVYMKKVE
ncbi:hypothetical protein [Bacillus testis]|uniref:hypothetical protein n=1 Tax=Bacillus testis TaxID=1622072 RepID=UPI00067EB739|nr:hypothetical protein [Bacillus testis]